MLRSCFNQIILRRIDVKFDVEQVDDFEMNDDSTNQAINQKAASMAQAEESQYQLLQNPGDFCPIPESVPEEVPVSSLPKEAESNPWYNLRQGSLEVDNILTDLRLSKELNSNGALDKFSSMYAPDYDPLGHDYSKYFDNNVHSDSGFWQKAWARSLGAMRVVGGAAEMAVAGALVDGVVTAPLGYLLGLHSADNMAAGATQFVTGQTTHDMTEKGLVALGLSERNAELTDSLFSIGTFASKGNTVAKFLERQGAEAFYTADSIIDNGTKYASSSYRFIQARKAVIGNDILNTFVGGTSAYMGGKFTGSDSPYWDAAVGGVSGFVSGRYTPPTFTRAVKVSMYSNASSNALGQTYDLLSNKSDSFSIVKVGISAFAGGVTGALTYGMPTMSAAIVGLGPDMAINKVGGAWYDHWYKQHK